MENVESKTSPINPSGESAVGAIPPASAATLETGRMALDQHTAENGRGKGKGRGRPIIHGKYSTKGKVPLGKMDNGANPLVLEEVQPAVVPVGVEAVEPAFNEKVNQEYASIIIGALVALNNARKRKRIIRETENDELAELAVTKTAISGEAKSSIQTGLVETARKYGIDLSKTPEGMIIGGLLLWQAEDKDKTNAVIAEYKRLRPQAVK